MSFLGCIGHVMASSGLEEILELVYAKNAVSHMLSGKAISRAVRGHLLVDRALNVLITSKALSLSFPDESPISYEAVEEIENQEESAQDQAEIDIDLLKRLCKESLENPQKAKEAASSSALEAAARRIKDIRISMMGQRTAKLWLLYMDMIDILRKFIKAERTGEWKLHLQAVYDMLPYFAATGHIQYAKSAYIYLQQMHDLEKSHPTLYTSFIEGQHVVRRSNRFWAGLSTDLVIEQVSFVVYFVFIPPFAWIYLIFVLLFIGADA